MLRNQFGNQLEFFMQKGSLSFAELSRLSGVNRDHLYHIIDSTKEVGLDTVEKILKGLNVKPNEFFNFDFKLINDIDRKILDDFNKLPTSFWDFKKEATDKYVHSLHPYPAVMVSPISRNILDIVLKHKNINCLLDPFAGSGTVLVEAQMHNIKNVIGNDLNPLANLISKAKTTILNNECVKELELFNTYIKELDSKYNNLIKEFSNYICKRYSIVDKDDWANNTSEIVNNYFKDTILKNKFEVPNLKNLGFWFRPETLPSIFLIKSNIDKENEIIKPLLYCTLSEVIRFVSNTRNSEFKLYRMEKHIILNKYYDVFKIFNETLEKNILKIKEYNNVLPIKFNSKVINYIDDCKSLKNISDESVDIIITSPPYGDSHTTVAYGQFSRLSNDLLDLCNGVTIDNILLGGKKIKLKNIGLLKSDKLIEIYETIKLVDRKRADEVLDFYVDLDSALECISRKTKIDGYNFWVVGNRTVKKTLIPTDVILEQMYRKYGMVCIKKMYRNISNKVMPSKNSPTNITGENVNTMTTETILFFKKVEQNE